MDRQDFPFDWEFYTGEDTVVEERLRELAERRISKLMRNHKDITGTSVALEKPAHRHTDFVYTARVIVYMRPDNVVAREKADSPEGALKGALDAIERQVRERREKLGKPWEGRRSGEEM